MTQIPYHKSERMFRRYEEHIFRIVKEFPTAVSFDPHPHSSETFMCRLRDSISSLLEFNWPTPIDVKRLSDIRPQFIIVNEQGMVVAKPKWHKPLSLVGKLDEVKVELDFMFELDKPRQEVFFAAVILVANKVINKPIKLKNVPQVWINDALDRYDVGISDSSAGFQILV